MDSSSEFKLLIKILWRTIKSSPATLRIFIEALSNAIDNVERIKKTDTPCTKIKVTIDPETGETSVWNDGGVVPVEIHEEKGCYDHTMIFGQLLTGSSYNDEEERMIAGRNGLGIKDVMSLFYSNFVHVDIYHLISNLFALYALSRVEVATGGKKFTALIVFLLLFNTLAEAAIHRLFKGLPCSIGFSGVLFGVGAWELFMNKEVDWFVVLSLVFMIAGPSIRNPKVSLMGHIVGAVAGVVGALLWSKMAPKLKL